MTIDLDELVPEFRAAVGKLLSACEDEGVFMEPYLGSRNPLEQARLWCQSRTPRQINQEIKNLRSMGADFLALCIEWAGEQDGPLVTNAIPGLSWRQWGEAIDCVWIVDRREEWSNNIQVNGLNGYRIYAQQAAILGLTYDEDPKRRNGYGHVRLRSLSSPLQVYSLEEINEAMKERFYYLLDGSSNLIQL